MAKDTEKLADDFEEFDFDFGDDDFGSMFNEAPPATGREAVVQTLKNAGANFASEFNVANIDNIAKLLEKTVKVLVNGLSEKDPTKVSGYTDTMKLVNFPGNNLLIGKIVDVKIINAKCFIERSNGQI
jgi:tRNA-2-methylthio-N6-dimethylallyladenosine synthase